MGPANDHSAAAVHDWERRRVFLVVRQVLDAHDLRAGYAGNEAFLSRVCLCVYEWPIIRMRA